MLPGSRWSVATGSDQSVDCPRYEKFGRAQNCAVFSEQARGSRTVVAHCRAAVSGSFPGLLCRSVFACDWLLKLSQPVADTNANHGAVQSYGLSMATFPMAVIHDTRKGKHYKMAALDTPATVESLQRFMDAYERGELTGHKTRAPDEL